MSELGRLGSAVRLKNLPRADGAAQILSSKTALLWLIALLMLAGAAPAARALSSGASAGTLYEHSSYGTEKVTSLGVWGNATGWTGCNGINCDAYPYYGRVTWNITDGVSTFDRVFAQNYGLAELACNGEKQHVAVYAGPSYTFGTQYVWFSGAGCTVGYNVIWDWAAGMCDTN